MDKNNQKKYEQLGMPLGTANAILRKNIMFLLIKELDLDWCYRCEERIESVDHLSIEHKTPWLDSESPKELFFSLDNIAFSHLKCNVGARRSTVEWTKHGTAGYNKKGCRCDICKRAKSTDNKKYHSKFYKTA